MLHASVQAEPVGVWHTVRFVAGKSDPRGNVSPLNLKDHRTMQFPEIPRGGEHSGEKWILDPRSVKNRYF